MRSRAGSLPAGVLGLVGVALALALGEVVPRLGLIDQKYLPPISQILAAFGTNLTLTAFWVAVWDTMLSWAIGLLIAAALAVFVGLVIGTNRTLREVELMLPASAFVRIHRSHTIHLRHIKKYVRGKGGHVVLQNSATLTVSAGQKDTFLDDLKQYFKVSDE